MAGTTPRRDGGDTPGGDWIRRQPELSSNRGYDLEDIDYVHTRMYYWHQYLHGELMIIEEKQFNRDATKAQKDTFGIVNQALTNSFADPKFRVKRKFPGRTNTYTYFGYHLVQYEKTSPLDGEIRIDYTVVTPQEYLLFLQFDRAFLAERLHFDPLTVPIHEQFHLDRLKRKSRKSVYPVVPTLFDPTHQQSLWELPG